MESNTFLIKGIVKDLFGLLNREDTNDLMEELVVIASLKKTLAVDYLTKVLEFLSRSHWREKSCLQKMITGIEENCPKISIQELKKKPRSTFLEWENVNSFVVRVVFETLEKQEQRLGPIMGFVENRARITVFIENVKCDPKYSSIRNSLSRMLTVLTGVYGKYLTISDFIRIPKDELMRYRDIGEKSIKALYYVLEEELELEL